MDLSLFLANLKTKYNYNDKLISALTKIVPAMIRYYGDSYKDFILECIDKTEIITCNEMETISLVCEKKKLIKENNEKSVVKDDSNLLGGKYISFPKVVFDDVVNSFIVPKISRYIILSHTYNLDSAAGIGALTRELIKLIKSYKKEYFLSGDLIIKRTGFLVSKEKIANNGCELQLDEEENAGLARSFDVYDEEMIVSDILNSKYTSRDYQRLKEVAMALCTKLDLKNDAVSEQIDKTMAFKVEFDSVNTNYFELLSSYTDELAELENATDVTLNDESTVLKAKIKIADVLKKIADICAEYFINKKNKSNVNSFQ